MPAAVRRLLRLPPGHRLLRSGPAGLGRAHRVPARRGGGGGGAGRRLRLGRAHPHLLRLLPRRPGRGARTDGVGARGPYTLKMEKTMHRALRLPRAPRRRLALLGLAALACLGCPLVSGTASAATPPATAPTVEEAKKFVADAEARLAVLATDAQRASWVQETYITSDTEILTAQANEKVIAIGVDLAKQ